MDDLPPATQAVVAAEPDELAKDKGNRTKAEQMRDDHFAFRR
jgi:hypothetical protein